MIKQLLIKHTFECSLNSICGILSNMASFILIMIAEVAFKICYTYRYIDDTSCSASINQGGILLLYVNPILLFVPCRFGYQFISIFFSIFLFIYLFVYLINYILLHYSISLIITSIYISKSTKRRSYSI